MKTKKVTPVSVLYKEVMFFQSGIDNVIEMEETEKSLKLIETLRNQIKEFEKAIKILEPTFYKDFENCSNLKQE